MKLFQAQDRAAMFSIAALFILLYNKEEVFRMPEISMFFGIRITIYYNDHNPPHIHAEYAGTKALIDIQESCVIKGFLPSCQLKLVLAWCVMYQDELMQNWELVKDGKEPNLIPPMKKG